MNIGLTELDSFIVDLVRKYGVLRADQIKTFVEKTANFEASNKSITKSLVKLKGSRIIERSPSIPEDCVKMKFDKAELDENMQTAVDVMLMFKGVTHHTPTPPPSQLCFFKGGITYNVICLPKGKEDIISIDLMNHPEITDIIAVLDDSDQLENIRMKNLKIVCVKENNTFNFYEVEGQG